MLKLSIYLQVSWPLLSSRMPSRAGLTACWHLRAGARLLSCLISAWRPGEHAPVSAQAIIPHLCATMLDCTARQASTHAAAVLDAVNSVPCAGGRRLKGEQDGVESSALCCLCDVALDLLLSAGPQLCWLRLSPINACLSMIQTMSSMPKCTGTGSARTPVTCFAHDHSTLSCNSMRQTQTCALLPAPQHVAIQTCK